MSGAVQGSISQTALMIAHSASVSSVLDLGIARHLLWANISTVVEVVNSNLYKCKEKGKAGWAGRTRRVARCVSATAVRMLRPDARTTTRSAQASGKKGAPGLWRN